MKMNTLIRISVFTFAVASSQYLVADEIEEQIKLGVQAYQDKDYKGAISELNYAIAQIREKLNAEQAVLLPEPPPGWTAEEVKNISGAMAMMGGGTQLSREYKKNRQKVEITLTANSPMVSGMMAMLANPMLFSSNSDLKPYRFKRMKGTKKITRREVEVNLAVTSQILLNIDGRDTDLETLEAFLKNMDFKAIKAALSQ